MTTTLFAIFGIALVAAMAWVITRIVNIFVELEELHQRVRTTAEKVENLLLIVKKQAERVDRIEQTKSLTDEHMKRVDEQIQIMTDMCELTRAVAFKVDEKCNIIDEKCNIIDEKCDIIKDKCNIFKETSAQEAKNERLAKYTELRVNGLSIRKAGEEVGVSYVTAKRYEKQRKAQSNETGDN